MFIENVDVYNLIPSQIMDMIEKLNNALNIIKGRKKTISRVAKFEKANTICPHCDSFNIVKNGHTKLVFKPINVRNVIKDSMI